MKKKVDLNWSFSYLGCLHTVKREEERKLLHIRAQFS